MIAAAKLDKTTLNNQKSHFHSDWFCSRGIKCYYGLALTTNRPLRSKARFSLRHEAQGPHWAGESIPTKDNTPRCCSTRCASNQLEGEEVCWMEGKLSFRWERSCQSAAAVTAPHRRSATSASARRSWWPSGDSGRWLHGPAAGPHLRSSSCGEKHAGGRWWGWLWTSNQRYKYIIMLCEI